MAASAPVLRPGPIGLRKWLSSRLMALMPLAFRLLRRFRPILRMGATYIVTRHDDVREVFATDHAFAVPYKDKLDVITGGQPFFLGTGDTAAYHAQLNTMLQVVRANDLPALAKRTQSAAEEIVVGSAGRIEVVDQLVRRVAFGVLSEYFGVPEPPDGDLRVWATRLFEFQFADPKGDPALRVEVDEIAPALRTHVDHEIARRKAALPAHDDILARCLKLQAMGRPGYSDIEIRTALVCMIVGGPPQPPMVVPQAMEQLLRRPDALAAAQEAARANKDALLHDIVIEAMRFDPLAPGLPRIAVTDAVIARGTRRETRVPKGSTVIAAFASAMMDERRLPEPQRFDPARRAYEYIHFGYGLHECFGRHINHATLHLILKPLLKQLRLRRASGPEGQLSKNGPFAERLVVEFG